MVAGWCPAAKKGEMDRDERMCYAGSPSDASKKGTKYIIIIIVIIIKKGVFTYRSHLSM